MTGLLFPIDDAPLKPSFEHESNLAQKHNALPIGTDEVGRGCLAGPVFAAAVFIPQLTLPTALLDTIRDSKKIPKAKLHDISQQIHEICIVSIAEASVREIEDINILHASLLAMKRACDSLHEKLKHNLPKENFCVIVDGIYLPQVSMPGQTLKQGDARSYSIASAAIVAKVERDKLMNKLAEEFSHYGWETNAGYGTKKHLDAIQAHGITQHHRKSFLKGQTQ
ncbi:MAG: ribonuclease HII [Alphaproteobacteria bacterium]|jgi:ribonuclease HII|nr:ribonuclease HII [Alphaproteobacteria bacterium]MBP9877683.1 ribonuclease HII [Alphaproteobacteria bacterium]